MKPIDRPFRPSADFYVAWLICAVGVSWYYKPWDFDLPWYSKVAWLIFVPVFATFVVYGPVLLVRQVVQSGRRGRFVIWTALCVVLAQAAVFGVYMLLHPGAASIPGKVLFTAGVAGWVYFGITTQNRSTN